MACTVILAGDFNCVMRRDDCAYKNYKKDSSVDTLDTMIRELDLQDVMPPSATRPARFTLWQGSALPRLDR